MNVLFICSRNQWRSPTAEAIFRGEPGLNVRSAGTASSARRKVSEDDILWADLVFVMESHHGRRLRQRFGALMEGKRVVDLDVPDEYRFMDEELVEILDDGVRGFLVNS